MSTSAGFETTLRKMFNRADRPCGVRLHLNVGASDGAEETTTAETGLGVGGPGDALVPLGDAVGNAVGDASGDAVGDPVGGAVGSPVGSFVVGAKVGSPVADTVGSPDDISVGSSDGSCDGSSD